MNWLPDGFINYISVQKRYSVRTQQLYANAIERFYVFILAPEENELPNHLWKSNLTHAQQLEVLTPNNIRGYIAEGMKGGLSARTENLLLSAISSFCTYLVKKGLLTDNPVRKICRPKEKKRLPDFYQKDALEEYFSGELQPG
ncbi:MAG: site-specific integrase, partial [Bacteroidales bacterium]